MDWKDYFNIGFTILIGLLCLTFSTTVMHYTFKYAVYRQDWIVVCICIFYAAAVAFGGGVMLVMAHDMWKHGP